jgi:hypothetical protein
MDLAAVRVSAQQKRAMEGTDMPEEMADGSATPSTELAGSVAGEGTRTPGGPRGVQAEREWLCEAAMDARTGRAGVNRGLKMLARHQLSAAGAHCRTRTCDPPLRRPTLEKVKPKRHILSAPLPVAPCLAVLVRPW